MTPINRNGPVAYGSLSAALTQQKMPMNQPGPVQAQQGPSVAMAPPHQDKSINTFGATPSIAPSVNVGGGGGFFNQFGGGQNGPANGLMGDRFAGLRDRLGGDDRFAALRQAMNGRGDRMYHRRGR